MVDEFPKSKNGIYSFFIRSVGVDLKLEEVEVLEKHAIKVVRGEGVDLLVGRYWIVLVWKMRGEDSEEVMVRCWRDVCDPYREIESYDVLSADSVPVGVEVVCEEWKKVSNDVTDFSCRVRYRYMRYSGIIAITVDPFDIENVASDEELKLLLDLAYRGTLLVRPM